MLECSGRKSVVPGHYEEAVSFLECVLQDMEPEAAMLLWPSRAQPVENPGLRPGMGILPPGGATPSSSIGDRRRLAPAEAGAYGCTGRRTSGVELVEASRWRISERTVFSYLAAVPALVVQKDSILNLVYDAGGLAIEQRYGAQQATMEELLLAFAHLSESIAKEE